jgi:hypothetical protein
MSSRLLMLLTLLVLFCIELTQCKVIRDAAKASSEPTAPPRIETAIKSVHLQSNTIELRYAVTKDEHGQAISLRVSAECDRFVDKMYLAIGFSKDGAMVPALALAGEIFKRKKK